jgi:mannose-P-dolichol utilization defect protein 1
LFQKLIVGHNINEIKEACVVDWNHHLICGSLSFSMSENAGTFLATALGYVIGFGSLMLYTPIAVRIYRQKSADGTTMSTWWLKLVSYTMSDTYYMLKGYPLSTYVETLTITIEAAIILGLVGYYQRRLNATFGILFVVYLTISAYGLFGGAPPQVVAVGQLAAGGLNSAALIPQFVLNYQKQSKGDYSPLTAGLATTGCAIRLFTIQKLAGSDPILMTTFGISMILNAALLAQIIYYGMAVEGLSLRAVLCADLGGNEESSSTTTTSASAMSDIGFRELETSETDDMRYISVVPEKANVMELSRR